MKLFKKKHDEDYDVLYNMMLKFDKNLSENKEEMLNSIQEIKYPLGNVLTSEYFIGWIATYTYVYYKDGKSYRYAIPVCEKYIVRKDDKNIYLKLQFGDKSTLDYLIQIGSDDLIEINSKIIDTGIDNTEWKNIEIERMI